MIKFWLPAILWSITILILTLIPGDTLPDVPIFGIDKLVHFFIFGVLMIVSSYGIVRTSNTKGTLSKLLVITSLYSISFGIMVEILQRFVPGRSFSIPDMVANSIGVGLGYLIFKFMVRRKIV
jgi:VanZ family protein